jgi:RNA polymerase sigma factor (sigma-70 family)
MDLHTVKLIIKGCLRGDAGSQQQLFRQYQQRVFSVCLRYARDRPEAQDMVQDAFLTIFRDLGQFKGDGAFEGWLQKVTIRSALQHLRKKNPLRYAEDYNELPADYQPVMPDVDLSNEALLQMVQQLPTGARTIFNLRCIEGFSYAEIAAELAIAESSVRSQYTRACKNLRDQVERFLSLHVTV